MPALVLHQQPEANFYKEEGGRSNTLSLCVGAPADAPFPQYPVRLSLQLCYENRNLCVWPPVRRGGQPPSPPLCRFTPRPPSLSALSAPPQGGGRPQHPQGRVHLAHL